MELVSGRWNSYPGGTAETKLLSFCPPARERAKNGKSEPERESVKEEQKVELLYLLYYLFCLVY
jgi:hypothetical protein